MNGPTNGINPVKQLDLLTYVHESEKEFYERVGQSTFDINSPVRPTNEEKSSYLQIIQGLYKRKLPFTLAVTLSGKKNRWMGYDAIALRNNTDLSDTLAHKIYWFCIWSTKEQQFTYIGCSEDLQDTTSDEARFIGIYLKACDGIAEAQVTLGEAFENGKAFQNGKETEDLSRAFRCYSAAYINKSTTPDAAFHVGCFYEQGFVDDEERLSKTLKAFNEAVKGYSERDENHSNIPICQRKIGAILLDAYPNDINEAIQMLTNAANASDIIAQIKLAEYYRKEKNHETAMRWYDEALQGTKECAYEYATYLLSMKEEKHTLKAIDLLVQLIEDGNIDAIRKMAGLLKKWP